MLSILREHIEGDFQITEYTRDGETVSHRMEVPVQLEIPSVETIPVPPTFEQRLSAAEDTITVLLGLLKGVLFNVQFHS